MDKTAQAARQARLAQALRTNLRRRKAGEEPRPGAEAMAEEDAAAQAHPDASPDDSAT